MGLKELRGGKVLREPCYHCGCRRYSLCNCMRPGTQVSAISPVMDRNTSPGRKPVFEVPHVSLP